MKACGVGVLALLVVAVGCTHTTVMNPSNLQTCARLNDDVGHRKAAITLTDGRNFAAKGLLLAPDSTSWLDPRTEELRTVPTAEVMEIRIVRHGKGALQGLGIGFLTGALTGAVVGFADGDDPPGWFSMTAEQKAGVLAVGPVAGAAVGSRDIYRFEAPHRWKDLR
jgi:hypothetical protein